MAWEPSSGVGLVLEVKWPAPPDHIIEILRIEDTIAAAQERTAKLRGKIASGEVWVRGFPGNWPPVEGDAWTWGVLVNDHLPPYDSAIRASAIRPTSWQLLWNRQRATLRQTVDAVWDETLLPREDDDFVRRWYEMSVGPYRVHIEGFLLKGGAGADRLEVSELIEEFIDQTSA